MIALIGVSYEYYDNLVPIIAIPPFLDMESNTRDEVSVSLRTKSASIIKPASPPLALGSSLDTSSKCGVVLYRNIAFFNKVPSF